jgi:mannose-1-phosphate guanylyltransferase
MSGTGRIRPVILSGGTGTRLWPLSRLGRPKQLIAIAGDETMLQATASRVADETLFAPPIVVAGEADAEAIEAQLAEVGMEAEALILEPAGRGTAPAIALAALAGGEDEVMLIMPSDHVIAEPAAFRSAVEAALPRAEEGWLVTFGISPERPETGYGYIRRGPALGAGAWRVSAFVEKPDAATAERYLAEGGYDWNAGLFLLRADAYLAALERYAPAVLAAAQGAAAGQRREGRRVLPDEAAFAAAPSVSIDVAVMEKADKVAVVPVEMGWSDVGSWEALHALGPADADGNVLTGDVVAPGSRGCLVRSDGPVVVAMGCEDMVVVATERAVLIVPRGQSQRVKEAIDALEARRRKD